MNKQNKYYIRKLRAHIKEFKAQGNIEMVLRLKVIIAHLSDQTISTLSTCFDVSEKTIRRWIQAYNKDGISSLQPKPRSGRPPKLNEDELNLLRERIESEQERVWVARHALELVITMFSVVYSVKYLPEILKNIGLSFHKAVHYLVKRNEEKRAAWIRESLPKIYESHIKEGWRIFFQDEVGFQTEGTLSYSWGPKGKDISVANKGRHGRVNLLGAYEVGSGEFFYRMTCFKVTALRFKRFLCALKRKFKSDKFIIIADNASFHKAKWFTAWRENISWLRLEFLPSYSPDFNPIERLWKWIKKEFTHNKCWRSKKELRAWLTIKLKTMSDNKTSYIGTMKKELERLRSACEYYGVPFVWENHLPKSVA